MPTARTLLLERWPPIAFTLLAGGLIAVAVVRHRDRLPGPAAPPASLDPRLAAAAPLDVGSTWKIAVAQPNSPDPLWIRRAVTAWEDVAGAPHARVEWATGGPPWRQRSVEWLRPQPLPSGELQVVCSLRQLAHSLHPIEPPQPVLILPLAVGRRWSWSGTVDGEEARLEAEVRDAGDGRFEVVRRVELGPVGEAVASEQTAVYGPGGLVSERWDLGPLHAPGGPRAGERANDEPDETDAAE